MDTLKKAKRKLKKYHQEHIISLIDKLDVAEQEKIAKQINTLHFNQIDKLYKELSKEFMTSYDESGSIGKRYRRADAIGTPFCITVDDETINNNMVTIRDRDTMEQISINVDEIEDYINKRIKL